MTSKTSILAAVKALAWRDVADGLDEAPELIRFRDSSGRSWLHLCCGRPIMKDRGKTLASIKLAKLLLQRGLDLNEAAFTEGEWRATPLWYAIAFGRNHALAKYLLGRGADPNHCLWAAAFNRDVVAIKLLAKHGALIDPVAEDASPFLFAVQWSHFEAAEALLKLGADVNFQSSRRVTALHCMLKKNSASKHFRMLLKYRPRGDLTDAHGKTAKEIMLRKRDPELRRIALELASA
jgi:uncharacterized protein